MSDFYSPYAGPNTTYHHPQQSSSSTYAPYPTTDPYREQPSHHENNNNNNTVLPQQSHLPSIWNPAVAATLSAASNAVVGNPNVMLDMGLKAGRTFLDQGTAKMIPGLERTMTYLRIYFAVNNSYVKRKMQRVLFSFPYRNWKRLVRHSIILNVFLNMISPFLLFGKCVCIY